MLIACPECQRQISDKASVCPNCGFPISNILAESNCTPVHSRRRSSKRMRLPNGFGRITEIKNKNLRKPFRVMISDGKDASGKPIGRLLKPVSYFETYNEAYKALMQYHDNPYNFSDDLTMDEVYDRWFERKKPKLSKDRALNIRSAWNYCDLIKNIKVQQIRARDIRNVLENGYRVDKRGQIIKPSPYMKINMKGVLNGILDYAVEYELIQANPAKTIKQEGGSLITQHSHISFTDKEMDCILKEVGTWQISDMMYVNCYMGWRPNELCDIKTSDVHMTNWTIIGGSKSEAGKNRVVPIHEKIRPIIQRYFNEAIKLGCSYLFSKNRKRLSYGIYRSEFNEMLKRNNLNEKHRPHDCRKQFVTMAKKAGVDEYAIKRIVGHRIKDLTESVYTDRNVEWLHREIKKIS